MTERPEELFDLLAAYAVDAIDDPAEILRIETELAHDKQLRRELDDHRAVLAALAVAVDPHPSTPSPLLWEGVVREIDGAGEVSPKLASVLDIRTQRRFTRMVAAISVAAIALAIALGASVIRLQQERSQDPVTVAIQDLLDDPAASVVTLGAEESATEARIVLGDDGVGYVYADNLPALDMARTYQLWAIVDDRVISAGVLGNDPENAPFQVVGDVAGFAITDEVAGGVAVSEGETVVVWLRTA